MIRNILNYQNQIVGTMELPDNTPESVWEEKLAPYKVAPPTDEERQKFLLSQTIKQRKEYAEDLIERLKAKNLTEGINALQAMYMHHKMRALSVTFFGVPMTIDIMNLVVSGDIEVACLALMNSQPDNMSAPYHWLNQSRINWIVADMKAYLGWT